MEDCFKIKDPEELIDYLKQQGRDPFHGCDYQLETNYGFVHELLNGEVIFFDKHYEHKAILFANKQCFENVVKADRFPIDNPHKGMFGIDEDRITTFHLQVDYYRNHLNNVLKFDFPEISKEAAQAYLKKVIGRFIKKLTTPTDVVALISVIGQLVKLETGGKWFLIKRYGTYNPIYEPNIVTASGKVILMSNKVTGLVKWRVSKLDHIFIDVHSELTVPISWEKYSKQNSNLILLE